MTDQQVKLAEETVLELISKNPPVYGQEAPLPLAKEVKGLRAMLDEVRMPHMYCELSTLIFTLNLCGGVAVLTSTSLHATQL